MKTTGPGVQSKSLPPMMKNGPDRNRIEVTGSSVFFGQLPEPKTA